ncbi:MAG: TetR/AcrR family transcriptional regulator [Spirochaetes bacterium]|nr:TetR/AcrR family transcriptional regulator [Spirochaetota bacterium]
MKARLPVQERGVRTKNRIIGAAKELFEEKGFHRTNSKEIAARAGVAVGTFYSYYDEKKPLFLDVIRDYYREVTAEAMSHLGASLTTLSVGDSGEVKKIIHEFVWALYRAHRISPGLHREISAMMYGDPEVEMITREEERSIKSIIREILAGIRPKLAVKDLDAAVHLVHRTTEEAIHGLRIFDSDISDERVLGELEDMLYRYLFVKV